MTIMMSRSRSSAPLRPRPPARQVLAFHLPDRVLPLQGPEFRHAAEVGMGEAPLVIDIGMGLGADSRCAARRPFSGGIIDLAQSDGERVCQSAGGWRKTVGGLTVTFVGSNKKHHGPQLTCICVNNRGVRFSSGGYGFPTGRGVSRGS